MMRHCERSTRRLSPSVSVALSRMPSSSCQSASRCLLDLVEQQDGELELLGVPLVERLLGEQGVGLAVAEVSRRRADQLGDLVGVLELGAVDLDAGARIAEQGLGHGFDHAGFARTGGPKKKKIADRTSGRVQARQKHLVDLGHLFNGGILADNFAAQGVLKLPGIVATAGRVEHCVEHRLHKSLAPFPWPVCDPRESVQSRLRYRDAK